MAKRNLNYGKVANGKCYGVINFYISSVMVKGNQNVVQEKVNNNMQPMNIVISAHIVLGN